MGARGTTGEKLDDGKRTKKRAIPEACVCAAGWAGELKEKRAAVAGRRETRGVEHTLWEQHALPTIPSYRRESVCPSTGWQRDVCSHGHATHTHTIISKTNGNAELQITHCLQLPVTQAESNPQTHRQRVAQTYTSTICQPLDHPLLRLPRSASPLWHRCQEGRGEKGREEGDAQPGREEHAVERRNRSGRG